MKKLFLLSLFILLALASFGQRFEVSEQAGASFTNSSLAKNGFANQLAFGYHPLKHFSVTAFYETNFWKCTNNSYGLSLDYTCRYFFAGIEGKAAFLAPISYTVNRDGPYTITYKTGYGYGAHIGSKQKIWKKLSLIEQVGFVVRPLAGSESYPVLTSAPVRYYRTTSYNETLNYLYARIGLSYRL